MQSFGDFVDKMKKNPNRSIIAESTINDDDWNIFFNFIKSIPVNEIQHMSDATLFNPGISVRVDGPNEISFKGPGVLTLKKDRIEWVEFDEGRISIRDVGGWIISIRYGRGVIVPEGLPQRLPRI